MITDALVLLANNDLQPSNRMEGICLQLFLYGGLDAIGKFKKAVLEWPEYSGEPMYPVPGGYKAYTATEDLWDPTTEYGQARRRLCGWYANYLMAHDV